MEKVQTSRRALKADALVLAIGIRPNTAFLEGTGIEMFKGTILTDSRMRTNVEDIYAAGDCAMVKKPSDRKGGMVPHGLHGQYFRQGSGAESRRKRERISGVLGTGVVKLPGGISAGRTGLTETAAKAEGYDVITALSVVDDKAHYYPGAGSFILKLVADKTSRKLLGVQVIGSGAVDKVTDIGVTAISLGATVDQLSVMDFAYAPPFSTAIHPFANGANVLMNKMDGDLESFTPAEYQAGEAEGYRVVDCSPGAGSGRLPLSGFDRNSR